MPEANEWGLAIDPEHPHLGGYVPGGDPATWYPDLWKWVVEERRVKSVLDVGCGEGHTVRFFRELGIAAWGIDGIAQDGPTIIQHDYTLGFLEPVLDGVDLVWSCEFVEHVEERYARNFLSTFACARFVLMTHGEPGQSGHHHVNNQTGDYWKGAMAAIGYEFDEVLTAQARGLASANEDPYNHFRRSGLAFRRYE